MSDNSPTRAGDVRVGTKVRIASRAGIMTAAGTITTDDGFTLSVPADLPVVVVDIPKPAQPGSAILGSLNGAADEVYVLRVGGGAGPRWVQASTGAVIAQADADNNLTIRAILFQAPPPVVPTR